MFSSVINSSKYYISMNSVDFQEPIFNVSITWAQSVLYFTKVSTLCYFASERVTTLTTTTCPEYHTEDTSCTIRNDSTGYLLAKHLGNSVNWGKQLCKLPLDLSSELSILKIRTSSIPNMKIPRVFPRYKMPVTTNMSNLSVVQPRRLLGSV